MSQEIILYLVARWQYVIHTSYAPTARSHKGKEQKPQQDDGCMLQVRPHSNGFVRYG
jgi:hypothetical protein